MLFENFLTLLSGLPLTLLLTLGGSILGLLCAILLTVLLSLFPKGLIYFMIKGYLIIFTGTPLLVQIFLIYYGPGQFVWIKDSLMWPLLSQAWFCAIIALALNSAAYTTQLFDGAMKAITKGQYDSCKALGMTPIQSIRLLLSLALRRALPSYSNELVLVLKSTSLVCTITLMDVMGYAQYLKNQTYDSLTYFCLAGIIYLFISSIMTIGLRYLEKSVLKFEK